MSYDELRRRKLVLQKRAAQMGINTDPAVTTEIEDIDAILHLGEQIELSRQRLRVLVDQSIRFGISTPPHVTTEIRLVRQQIEGYKATMRKKGFSPEDQPVDSDLPAVPEPVIESGIPARPDLLRMERMLERLCQYMNLSTD